MKENTFDVPAYKFFAFKIDDRLRYHTKEEYKLLFHNNDNNIIFIPFENIDGLKVEEVQSLLSTSEIVLGGGLYYHFNYDAGRNPYQLNIEFWIYFTPDYLNEHREKTIDKLLEEAMERSYMSEDENNKRIFRCFFERYQDGSYRKTKKRIRKLERKRNI